MTSAILPGAALQPIELSSQLGTSHLRIHNDPVMVKQMLVNM